VWICQLDLPDRSRHEVFNTTETVLQMHSCPVFLHKAGAVASPQGHFSLVYKQMCKLTQPWHWSHETRCFTLGKRSASINPDGIQGLVTDKHRTASHLFVSWHPPPQCRQGHTEPLERLPPHSACPLSFQCGRAGAGLKGKKDEPWVREKELFRDTPYTLEELTWNQG
jgi:hypothetical protein